MPRTGKIKPREVEPEAIYQNKIVSKLINIVMKSGKRSVSEKQVYQAFTIIKDKLNKDPIEIFETAVRNVTPQMEVRSRRVGGAAYQVPTPIKGKRGTSLSLRWIVRESRKRPNNQYHTFAEKLAAELMDAAKGEGLAFQRKITAHKMADSNKAFAHFRW